MTGIRFRSDGNPTAQAAYDSSNKWDTEDAKAQYGYAVHLFDGPIIWSAKKHAHVGTSSTHNEYMALYHFWPAPIWVCRFYCMHGTGAAADRQR
eukprot:SAG11_NODE_3817_length_2210_cov_2.749408_1_plen_94_part_00